MRLTLRQLEHVVAVAHLGSFSRAAAELHLSQPGLSRSIAALEEEYGVRLFDRTRSTVTPTAVGLALIEHAERLLLQARALERNLRLWSSGEGGSIAFGMGPTAAGIIMPPLLALLATRHPSLRVTARTNNAQTLHGELGRNEIEFLVCNRSLLPAHADLAVERIGTIQLGLYVRAGHPLTATGGGVDVEALLGYPLARGSIPVGRLALAGNRVIEANAAIECDNYHVLKEVMLSSDAVWLASRRLLAAELADGRAMRIACPDFDSFTSDIDLVWPVGRALSPAARMVADLLGQLLEEGAAPA